MYVGNDEATEARLADKERERKGAAS